MTCSTNIRRKIKKENILDIIDPSIRYVEELDSGITVIPDLNRSGFTMTSQLIILWVQKGDDIVRQNFWKQNQVKIART